MFFACPGCGATVKASPNPFYGIGLSVHKHIRLCTECSWCELSAGAVLDREQVAELTGIRIGHGFFRVSAFLKHFARARRSV